METYAIRHLDGRNGDLIATVTTRGGIVVNDMQDHKVRTITPAYVKAKGSALNAIKALYAASKSDRFWWTGIDRVM